MNKSFSTIFLMIVILQFSCSEAVKPDKIYEAEFEIDSSLLSSMPLMDSSLNFQLGIPANWEVIDNTFKKRLNSTIIKNLRYGYYSTIDSSNLIILGTGKNTQLNYTELRKNYRKILNDSIWNDIQYNIFSYRSHLIEQYVLQNQQLLNFRLIVYDMDTHYNLDSLPKFEMVYNINRNNYQTNIKAVEYFGQSVHLIRSIVYNYFGD